MRKFVATASALVASALFIVVPASAAQAAPASAAKCGGCTIGF